MTSPQPSDTLSPLSPLSPQPSTSRLHRSGGGGTGSWREEVVGPRAGTGLVVSASDSELGRSGRSGAEVEGLRRQLCAMASTSAAGAEGLELGPLSPDDLAQTLLSRRRQGRLCSVLGGWDLVMLGAAGEAGEAEEEAGPSLRRLVFVAGDADGPGRQHHALVFLGTRGSRKAATLARALNLLASRAPNEKACAAVAANEVFAAFTRESGDRETSAALLLDLALDFRSQLQGFRLHSLLLPPFRPPQSSRQTSSAHHFHVFTALLHGLPLQYLKNLRLQRNQDAYSVLGSGRRFSSGSGRMEPAEAKALYRRLVEDLGVLGVAEGAEGGDLWKVLAALLKLGNLEFTEAVAIEGTRSCAVEREEELVEVSASLGLDAGLFSQALRTRLYHNSRPPSAASQASGSASVVRLDLSADEAREQRDALLDSVWRRLLLWLVQTLNEAGKSPALSHSTASGHSAFAAANGKNVAFLQVPAPEPSTSATSACLQTFLQNVALERLEAQMVQTRLREEQATLTLEGVPWHPIPFRQHSADCLQRLDKVLALLDAARFPDQAAHTNCQKGHCESAFVAALAAAFPSDPFVSARPQDASFTVLHFHGPVRYDGSTFVADNHQTQGLTDELRDLLGSGSRCGLLRWLFPCASRRSASFRQRLKPQLTTSAQESIALSSVLGCLEGREMSYVFCLEAGEGGAESLSSLRRQVEELGLAELSAQAWSGYAHHRRLSEAMRRYRMLSRATWPRWSLSPGLGMAHILAEQGLTEKDYAVGPSRIFFRRMESVWRLEEAREMELHRLARLIQWSFRFWYYSHGLRALNAAATVIAAQWRGLVARRRYRQLRDSARTIAAHFRGWRVRRGGRQGPGGGGGLTAGRLHAQTLVKFFRLALRRRYLQRLRFGLPSDSPLDDRWPDVAPKACHSAHEFLRILHHRWRCRKYRESVSQEEYFRMREKLAASLIFRHKKAAYPMTVSHPFRGDYVRLRQNPKWRRISLDTADEYVVFADLVSKVNRASGKVSSVLLVVSTAGVVILDHRSLNVKARAAVAEVEGVSLSPFADTLAVLHLSAASALSKRGGDFLLECRHVVELVAKLYLVVQNVTEKPPPVAISASVWAESAAERVEVLFRPAEPSDLPDAADDTDEGVGCFSHSTPHRLPSASTPSRLPSPSAQSRTLASLPSNLSDASTPSRRVKFLRRGHQLIVQF